MRVTGQNEARTYVNGELRGGGSSDSKIRADSQSGPINRRRTDSFKKLAIWVAILVLLAALFQLFNNSTPSRRGNETTFRNS